MRESEVIRKRCEELGEARVRQKLAEGHFGSDKRPIIENWLLEKDKEKEAFVKSEELDIAREANQISKDSNNLSKIAIGVALISLFVSILVAIFK